jgi:hypothetical protein
VAGGRARGKQPFPVQTDITVTILIARSWDHAQHYCRKPDRTPTSEVDNVRQALRPLRRFYGETPARKFEPLAAAALQKKMIESRLRADGHQSPEQSHPHALQVRNRQGADCVIGIRGAAYPARLAAGRSHDQELAAKSLPNASCQIPASRSG